MGIYEYSAQLANGETKALADYNGRVLLIVNTASGCGFTPQFEGLQSLYNSYHDKGLDILGFPCNQFNNQEPGTEEEIVEFCKSNFSVTFPIFKKLNVKGKDQHPLFRFLTQEAGGIFTTAIKWNFTKFLIGRDGEVIKRYAPIQKPEKIESDIKKALDV